MKGRWFNTLLALALPPVLGLALCIGFVVMLQRVEPFHAPEESWVQSLINSVSMPSNAAEIRAASPTGKVYQAPAPQGIPAADEEKLALKKAAEKKMAPANAAAGSVASESEPAPPVIPPAAKRQPVTYAPPVRVWRPILDPIAEFWPTLWPRTDALPAVFQAVMLRDAEYVAKLVALGFSPHEKTHFGDTALCAAVRSGQEEMVQVLAMCGVDLNEPGRENQAPILVGSLRRNTNVLAALTQLGVDPNTRFKSPISKELIERCLIKDLRNAMESDRGVTPLICCASRGDVEGAVALMKAGAKAGMCTSRYHRYPINFAATQGYLFLMRVLLGRDPDSEPDTLVTVDLSSQRAWVTKHGKVVATTMVSTGREGYRTPSGRYVITDKHRSHTSTLYHVAMPWFMRLNCSAIGLHSGYVTGSPASHGCIRLPYDKAKLFFSLTDVGDEVQIVH